jgi:hypothetical protein
MISKRFVVGVIVILAMLAGLGAWQKEPLLAWWRVRQVTAADETNREARISQVVDLGQAALPRLVKSLETADAHGCANLERALVGLARRWQTHEPGSLILLESLRDGFAKFTPDGKASALRVATALLNQDDEDELLPVALTQAAGDLLKAAETTKALRPQVLHLAGALLDRVPPGQWLDAARKLALQGLGDASPKTRAAALHLTMRKALRTEQDLLTQAMPLLRDSEAEVRRAAVLALGASQELVSEEELLPLLHDRDVEVQHLCELALRGRGLQQGHLELARLISDENPVARLQVLQKLRGQRDIEPGVWLRRLSQDPAPAVRAAAVRAAAVQPRVDLRDRLQEMAQKDASPTVRELAAHYLVRPD